MLIPTDVRVALGNCDYDKADDYLAKCIEEENKYLELQQIRIAEFLELRGDIAERRLYYLRAVEYYYEALLRIPSSHEELQKRCIDKRNEIRWRLSQAK